MLGTNELKLACCKCSKEITGQPYQFGGYVACEKCVRNYYRHLPEAIPDELRIRARGAVSIVRDLERRHAREQRGRFGRRAWGE